MGLTIESLGFTKEELQERVVERLCQQILTGVGYDEDGDEFQVESRFAKTVESRCREHIDTTINTLAEKHILPNVAAYVENLTLQETTKWGEKVGKPVTFLQYLTGRAEAYMQEKVDFQGKGKGESGGYSWSGTQTRLTHLVESHLHYSIESAMKDAMQTANSAIAIGIQETVRVKLAEVAQSLKVSAKVK